MPSLTVSREAVALLGAENSSCQRRLWSREVARWRRSGIAVAGPFGCRCLSIPSMLRFHLPLIKPDKRFTRIRLPEKASWFRSRSAISWGRPFETDQPQHLVQVVRWIAVSTGSLHLVLST